MTFLDIDIDRLEEADRSSKLFSFERSNLFRFNRNDHGERKTGDLRPWAEAQFLKAGVKLDGGAIRLVTFARHLFYKFSPISLWLGFGPEGQPRGILYEVNNTFGETHTYAAALPGPGLSRHSADKVFHVSPFFDVSGRYEFSLRLTDERLNLVIASRSDKTGQAHVATLHLKASPASDLAFAKLAILAPLNTLGVIFAIHWQALKLWLKGAKYHAKPKQAAERISLASAEKTQTRQRENTA